MGLGLCNGCSSACSLMLPPPSTAWLTLLAACAADHPAPLYLLQSALAAWKACVSRRLGLLEQSSMGSAALVATLHQSCEAATAAWSCIAHTLAGTMRTPFYDPMDEEASWDWESVAVDCAMEALLLPVICAVQLASVAARHGRAAAAAAQPAAHAARGEEAEEARLGASFRAAWAHVLGALGNVAGRSLALQRGQASTLARELHETVEKVHVNALGLAALHLTALCAACLVLQVLALLNHRYPQTHACWCLRRFLLLLWLPSSLRSTAKGALL